MPFTEYLKELRKHLRLGDATEHTHRPALKTLLEQVSKGITATNEPKHITDVGAPDFIVRHADTPLGYIECKDIGTNLDQIERSDQFKRYLAALPNLIFTDYLEFRWYREGELCRAERLGRLTPDRSDVKRDSEGVVQVQELLEGFFSAEPIAVGTAQELARYMAAKAKQLRDNAQRVLSQEGELGSLHALHQAFRETLIHDLDADQFADMYAQTLAYGLFSSCFELRRREPGAEFDRFKAEHYVPRTNPFLRQVFDQIAGPDLDRSLEWIANDIAELLNRADMNQIAADFARKPGREDPVVHFYEDFLRAYDPAKRKARGVYYTPEPVVSYIVRSIDHLLKEKFDRPLGLADENVYILDPACGTGTFLYFVIDQIHQNMQEAGLAGVWPDYVKNKLLPRIFGFELLMAPYTIAHMKLAIQLQDLGYDFSGDERLGIYLTNTLEEAVKVADTLMGFGLGLAIAEEANAAADIKREKPIMVVLGNPPYSSSSVNRGPWITRLIEQYKTTVREEETQISALSDDYIKFMRFAQWRIARTGHGIVGLITNNNYLDGIVFRDVRSSLVRGFSSIHIIDLHGNLRRRETTPAGHPDENVFDIQQGVGIALFERGSDTSNDCVVLHTDVWGNSQAKYEFLAAKDVHSTSFAELEPQAPDFLLVPLARALPEYQSWHSITYAFGTGHYSKDKTRAYGTGFKTQQDEFAICFTPEEVCDHMAELLAPEMSEAKLRERYKLCSTQQWDFHAARSALEDTDWRKQLKKCLYRPFDERWTVFSRHVVTNPRLRIMCHLLQPNLGLCIGHAGQAVSGYWSLVLATNLIEDQNLFRRGGNMVFPLYLYASEGTTEQERRPNLNPDFVKEFSEKLGLDFIPDGQGDLENTFGPEDVFYYAYAVFHSPTYRERYAEFLKIDFPRLPLTSDKELFARLVEKGKRLADLHLLRATGQIGDPPAFNIPGSNEVARVRYVEMADGRTGVSPVPKRPSSDAGAPTGGTPVVPKGRVYINKQQYFEGVEPEVWEFQIGGYQVCQKWLKDRTIKKLGRSLNTNDITHYRNIVLALRETRQLMAEIDEVIPGWPIE